MTLQPGIIRRGIVAVSLGSDIDGAGITGRETVTFSVPFAVRIPEEQRQEVSMLLLTLNANLPEGQLLLDMEHGFVYYRLKFVVDDLNISDEEILNRIRRMEEQGVSMAHTYARIITEEFYF